MANGQRRLVGYRPWGCKEPDTTEQLSFSVFMLSWLTPLRRPYSTATKSVFTCWWKMGFFWSAENCHSKADVRWSFTPNALSGASWGRLSARRCQPLDLVFRCAESKRRMKADAWYRECGIKGPVWIPVPHFLSIWPLCLQRLICKMMTRNGAELTEALVKMNEYSAQHLVPGEHFRNGGRNPWSTSFNS